MTSHFLHCPAEYPGQKEIPTGSGMFRKPSKKWKMILNNKDGK